MRVGDRLAELLLENGVDYVFGVPGGQTLPLYEGISKFQGRIEHVQKNYYDENYVSTDFSHVDFATVARGFGARGYTATTLDEVRECLALEESPDGPAVIDVLSDQWETPVLGL